MLHKMLIYCQVYPTKYLKQLYVSQLVKNKLADYILRTCICKNQLKIPMRAILNTIKLTVSILL